MHTPVLLQEAVEYLAVTKEGYYIDATFGEGGHSEEILKMGGRVLGIEWNENQYQISRTKADQFQKLKLVCGNFKDIEKIAKENGFYPADGILFDLGISFKEIEQSGRGFSYRNMNEPLDMRISSDLEDNAADIINSWNEQSLYEILAGYGEEIHSQALSHALVRTRSVRKIEKVQDLISIINQVVPGADRRTYARIFQALRIAVNHELDNLDIGLMGAMKTCRDGGRIVVITFHSLEDRIVKQFIEKNELRQINKSVWTAGPKKHFERSAKLRVIEIKKTQ